MSILSDEITERLQAGGAKLVGFADLGILPASVRCNMPRAVVFAVPMEPEVIAGIQEGPTTEYYAEYDRVNALLGELSRTTADLIRSRGFTAISSAGTNEGIDWDALSTALPHKTAATLAGLGWIGKCDLLVTESFGSAIRLNRVLTDAPLPAGMPQTKSRCGRCRECVDACPARAQKGMNWSRGMQRDELLNVTDCLGTIRVLTQQRTGKAGTICGICIAVCPRTRAYIKKNTSRKTDQIETIFSP